MGRCFLWRRTEKIPLHSRNTVIVNTAFLCRLDSNMEQCLQDQTWNLLVSHVLFKFCGRGCVEE